MKHMKISIVLLALLLAAMAMVPPVSAGKILPSKEILDMEYFTDYQTVSVNTLDSEKSTVSEYSLVTVDSEGFRKSADRNTKILITLEGKE